MHRQIPKALYKHAKSEHIDLAVKSGLIRLSPLAFYRSSDPATRDELEGLTRREFALTEPLEIEARLFNKAGADNIRIQGSGGEPRVYIQPGANVSLGSEVPNHYIFCVSADDTIRPDFGGAKYAITNPVGFGSLLARTLVADGVPITQWALGKVQYADTRDLKIAEAADFDLLSSPTYTVSAFDLDGAPVQDVAFHHGYCVKGVKFADEQEWRYVFEGPDDLRDSFVDIVCNVGALTLHLSV